MANTNFILTVVSDLCSGAEVTTSADKDKGEGGVNVYQLYRDVFLDGGDLARVSRIRRRLDGRVFTAVFAFVYLKSQHELD